MKQLNLDGHKLAYHGSSVNEYLMKGDTTPIYMEVSPVGSCNHRCVFCAYDFIGYPNRRLDLEKFFPFVDAISENGLKSMLYAGEGEPLMHPKIVEMITYTKSKGIDIGMFTNGELLKPKYADEILPRLEFIRFSFNAGNAKNYKEIHKTKEKTYEKVLNNIRYCTNLKKEENLSVTLGVQFVLLPENIDYLEEIVQTMSEVGVDYIAIKPFVQQSDQQFYKMQKQFDLGELDTLFTKIESYSRDGFQVIARKNAFSEYGERNYKKCYGTSFITVLNSAGDLATCLPYWEQKEYVFGNIYEESFEEIWNGERRAKIKHYLEQEIDVSKCPPNCRPNAINSYLYELKNPSVDHINFI